MFTSDEQHVLDQLTLKGFDHRDVAGLTVVELQDELSTPIDPSVLQALRKKVWSIHCRPRSQIWKPLLPQTPATVTEPAAVAPKNPKPTGPPRPHSTSKQYKHKNVAVALLETVLHPTLSLAVDDLLRSGLPRHVWIDAAADSLLARFQPGTLAAVLRTWNRLTQWQLETNGAIGQLTDVSLRKFLVEQEERGRTVPTNVYRHLRWMQEHLKVSLPLASPVLKNFSAATVQTWPSQVEVLLPQVWRHLLELAASSNQPLALAAGLIVRFAVSGLRFKHCARAFLDQDLSSRRASVWRISQGKDGMPFAIALPNYVVPGLPLLSRVQSEVARKVGVGTPFLPDMWFEAGSVVFRSAPAPYSRFQAFTRSILQLPPLSLDEQGASNFSTRSFRRFLPTVADALQLDDSDRLCLGNWADGRRLPLPVRYSSERLESAAQARRLCLASVHHLLKHVPQSDSWSSLRAVVPHLDRLRNLIAASSWGPGIPSVPVPELVESSPVPTEVASGSGDSSSPSSDASSAHQPSPANGVATDVESIFFVCPAKGLWHITEDSDSLTPFCSSRVFRQTGVQWATGLTAALTFHGKFCAPCLLRLPTDPRNVILSQATPR